MNEVRDKEKIRRALEAALAGLDAPTEAAAPMIIVLGDSRSSAQESTVQGKQSIINPQQPYAGSTSSHPGLQRFPALETELPAPAFKPCFMEPDRECVHSGACEMRGY
jgi:hypothetical protein